MGSKKVANDGNRVVVTRCLPGVIGSITWLHACYYHENCRFDRFFEIEVGSELYDFIQAFDPL